MRKLVFTLGIALLLSACHGASTSSEIKQADTTATQPRVVTIAMTGDIMMGTLFPRERLPQDSARHIFDDVAPVLQAADVACGNLEGAMAYSGKPRKNMASPLAFAFMMPSVFSMAGRSAEFASLMRMVIPPSPLTLPECRRPGRPSGRRGSWRIAAAFCGLPAL